MPNGELRLGPIGAILAGMGARPGVADLALVLPGRPTGLPRAQEPQGSQKRFREAALAAGALYEVARTTDEAIAVLSGWGAIRVSGTHVRQRPAA